MLRQRLAVTSFVSGITLIASFGCARELTLEDPPNLEGTTIAQFDPTNPIPVLQLIPSPTALAQNPDGTINKAAVAPEPCELPTLAQCLQFVDGWPTTTDPTLYFSRQVTEASLLEGVKWFEVTATGLEPITFTAEISERPPVNPACQTGDNGSDPPRTYTDADVPPGFQAVLDPDRPLRPGTRYIMAVVSNEQGGVRGPEGDVVEPSALFSILNAPMDAPPVTKDGDAPAVLVDGLLRSQVQGATLDRLFPGRTVEDLTDAERAQLQMEIQASAERLYGLYGFVSMLSGTFLDAGIVQARDDLVWVNSWTTAPASPGEFRFDPQNGIVPIPNTQLLTVPDMNSPTGRRVNLPPDDTGSPTRAALIMGLNTLNGFAGLAPVITVTANALLDTTTLAENIKMYEVDADGNATGEPKPLQILTSSVATGTTAVTTLRLIPELPLREGTDHVVVITRGVETADGAPVVRNSTFNILTLSDEPFIDADGDVTNPLIRQLLECRPVSMGASMLGSPEEVAATAALLENSLNHQGWVEAFEALANHTDAEERIPRDDILMAWTHTTQTVTYTIQEVAKPAITGGVWGDLIAGPAVSPPLAQFVGTATISELVGVVENLCLPICLQGEMDPDIPVAQCLVDDGQGNQVPNPAIAANTICQLAVNIIAGQLSRASLHIMEGFELRTGNPYVRGTFDPAKFAMPGAQQLQVFVIEPTGTPPADGWPVVIFQHGLGQVKESGFYIANTLARNGFATVLMDLPYHGSRASDLAMVVNGPLGPQQVPCTDANGIPNIDPAGVTCTPNSDVCTGGCDDIRDSSGTGFLSSNLFGARDNFRQGIVDHLTLITAIKNESGPGGALEILDGDSIGYIGQSLGGITGANLSAHVTPDEVMSQVLNVAGGDLVTILLNAIPQISAPLFVALNAAGVCEFNVPGDPTSGCQPTPAFLEFLSTARWALEPADPAALAQAVPTAIGNANILMQMSMPDPVVTNEATFILAGLLGFVNAQGMPTEQLQIYDFSMLPQATMGSGCHGWLLAPVCGVDLVDTLCNSIGAQEQAAAFIVDQTVGPKRPGTVAGVPCP